MSAETGLATILAPTGEPAGEGIVTGSVLEVYGPIYPPGFLGSTGEERLAAVKGWAGVSIDFDDDGYRLIGAEPLVYVEPISWPVD